jgi:hypothetical protein
MSETINLVNSITETSDVFIKPITQNNNFDNNFDNIFSFDIFIYSDYIITLIILLCILTIFYIIFANIYSYKYM